jgi:hypothetical protein
MVYIRWVVKVFFVVLDIYLRFSRSLDVWRVLFFVINFMQFYA